MMRIRIPPLNVMRIRIQVFTCDADPGLDTASHQSDANLPPVVNRPFNGTIFSVRGPP